MCNFVDDALVSCKMQQNAVVCMSAMDIQIVTLVTMQVGPVYFKHAILDHTEKRRSPRTTSAVQFRRMRKWNVCLLRQTEKDLE